MAVTRLKRKGAKNKSRAKSRVKTIQRLNSKPEFQNIDVEAIKAEWADKDGGKKKPAAKKAAKKEEAPVAETAAEETPAADTTEGQEKE